MLDIILMAKIDIFMILFMTAIFGFVFFIFGALVFRDSFWESKEKKARKNQRLMFNQIKRGDYIWQQVKDKIIARVVTSTFPMYNGKNECVALVVYCKIPGNDYDSRRIDINLDEVKSFKYQDYYTLFDEVKAVTRAIKNKRDKEALKLSTTTVEDIKNAADGVNKRLNELIKQYNQI